MLVLVLRMLGPRILLRGGAGAGEELPVALLRREPSLLHPRAWGQHDLLLVVGARPHSTGPLRSSHGRGRCRGRPSRGRRDCRWAPRLPRLLPPRLLLLLRVDILLRRRRHWPEWLLKVDVECANDVAPFVFCQEADAPLAQVGDPLRLQARLALEPLLLEVLLSLLAPRRCQPTEKVARRLADPAPNAAGPCPRRSRPRAPCLLAAPLLRPGRRGRHLGLHLAHPRPLPLQGAVRRRLRHQRAKLLQRQAVPAIPAAAAAANNLLALAAALVRARDAPQHPLRAQVQLLLLLLLLVLLQLLWVDKLLEDAHTKRRDGFQLLAVSRWSDRHATRLDPLHRRQRRRLSRALRDLHFLLELPLELLLGAGGGIFQTWVAQGRAEDPLAVLQLGGRRGGPGARLADAAALPGRL
mmetsp:Transcript_10241/g.25591  ORF Transcript_10241/g.25591 Transcript_10241/m.25591 type:complete len:411 (+) Transcript_10241:323-1555(+)